jgi:8-oxo-dGTP pyrophosphatase MutT (NUDIX family)
VRHSTASLTPSPLILDLPIDAVSAVVSGDYAPPPALAKCIERNWCETLARRPDQYDGSLCRLVDVEVVDGRAVLNLERTSFSAYVGTRSPDALNGVTGERADPLGLTVLVQTRDARLLVTRRSTAAEQNPGGLYFVGGYMEPPPADGQVAFAEEVAREVGEEIGVVLEPRELRILGIGYDDAFCHPEAFFLAITSLTAEDILAAARRARDASEADRIYFLSLNDLTAIPSEWIQHSTWSYRTGANLMRDIYRDLLRTRA